MPEVSTMIREVFDSLYELRTAHVSTYPLADQYARPPFFRFRIENCEKSDPVYQHIRNTVEAFKGHSRWSIYTSDDVPNYILVPELAVAFLPENKYRKEELSIHFGDDGYRSFVDQAIADIPALARFLADNLRK
jgi:hypothetical protein